MPLQLRGNHLRSPYAHLPLREKLSRPLHAALALRGKHSRSPQVNIPLCNSHYRLGLPVLDRREPGQRRHHLLLAPHDEPQRTQAGAQWRKAPFGCTGWQGREQIVSESAATLCQATRAGWAATTSSAERCKS